MSTPVSGGAAVRRLREVTEAVIEIAEREELIAKTLRAKVSGGEIPQDVHHRVLARADSLLRLASDLRKSVGAPPKRNW